MIQRDILSLRGFFSVFYLMRLLNSFLSLSLAAFGLAALMVSNAGAQTGGFQPRSQLIPTPTPTPTPGPFTIGALLSLSGSGKPLAEDFKLGAEIGIDEVNRAGGVGGMPVRMIVADLESAVSTTQDQFKKLVLEEKVDALIGDVLEKTTEAIETLANTYSRVLLTPALFDSTLPLENRFVFSLFPNKTSLHPPVEKFFRLNSSVKNIVILCSSSRNGVTYLDVWRDLAAGSGVTISEEMCATEASRDYRVDVARAQGAAPQAMIVTFATDQVIHWMNTFGFKPTVLSTRDIVDAVTYGKLPPKDAEGVYVIDWPIGDLVREQFSTRTGRQPTLMVQMGYEAVRALARAANLNRSSLLEGLRKVRYDGSGGPMDFTFEFGPNKARGILRRYSGGVLVEAQ